MAKALPIVLGLAAIVATGGAAIPAIAGIAGTIAIGSASISVLGVIGVGLSIAGTLAGTLLAPQPPKPKFEDGSQSIKQAVPARTRCYGEYRLAGAFIFYSDNDGGGLDTLVCHAAHECEAVVEHWLADDVVEVREDNGGVTTDPYSKFRAGTNSSVYIHTYLGTPDQTITLPAAAAEWTVPAHRGRGLCCTYVGYSDLKPEQQSEVFPSGPPAYRATLKGAKIYDPREEGPDLDDQHIDDEESWAWSDNAALVLLDYLTRTEAGVPVGFGLDIHKYIDLASFAAAATVCDQLIPLKDPLKPAEKRWRSCGAYDLTEDRKSVLSDLLDACGGRLTQGPDGKIGLSVGAPNPVAGVTVNDDQILEYDFSTGTAAITRINEVRATYVSKAQNWAETEAGIQMDQDSIDRNGTESSGIKLRFVPTDGQAQRVARYTLKHGNPEWAGKVRGTLALLDAWGERWIRLQISELEIDQVFEITGMRIDRTTMTVEMDVTSYDGWWDWTAATDERDSAPVPDGPSVTPATPAPTGVISTVMHRQYDAQTLIATAVIAWAAPPSASFVAEGRWRKAGGAWQSAGVIPDTNTFETPPLEDGQNYEAGVRFKGPRGTSSSWTAAPPFMAVADPASPGMPTGLTAQAAVPGVANVTVTATAPNSPRHAALRFFRSSTTSFVGATQLGSPLYGAPGAPQAYIDTPGVGDWYYFATAANWSDVQSLPAGPQLAELAPAAPAITSPSGPLTTYDTRPPVSGTSMPGAAIKLFANAVQVGTGTANGSGVWTVTPTTPLGLGINNVTATQTVAGNESLPSGLRAVTVNAIDADAWAYIAAMTVMPSFARQTLLNTLFIALKTAGVWAVLDCLYLLAAHDAQAARLNAKAPATFALTATASPVFTADHGYKGTGVGSTAGGYLTSTFVPSTAGGQWALNSAHLSVWVRTAATTSASQTSAEIGTSGAFIFTKDAVSGNIRTALNDGSVSNTAAGAPTGLGHFCLSRTGSTVCAKYHDGAAQAASAVTSTALPATAVTILRAGTTSYSDAEVCAAHWGAGLTATQELDLYNAIHAYLQGVGAVL
ncbi:MULTISPECIES: phage tail protein [unclassified Inquilinus]|uniref:phage tail protein n=1 Tax=unclassified Inquilinus TaxID=2645927 RepID=UPI003F925F1E